MSKQDVIELEGIVVESLRGGKFIVELEENKHRVTCSPCGKIQMNKIRILVGDKVTVEMSPYNLDMGRISWRYT